MNEKRLKYTHFRHYWLVTMAVFFALQYYWITKLSHSCVVPNVKNHTKAFKQIRPKVFNELETISFLVCSIGTHEEDQLYLQAIRKISFRSKVKINANIFPHETCLDSVRR